MILISEPFGFMVYVRLGCFFARLLVGDERWNTRGRKDKLLLRAGPVVRSWLIRKKLPEKVLFRLVGTIWRYFGTEGETRQ